MNNEQITTALVFLTGDEPYTTSEAIADAAGVKRNSVTRLINSHEKELEALGKVRFEIEALPGSKTGQKVKIYSLNEQQATFLVTLLKNTPQVTAFKMELVRQFYEMKEFIKERHSEEWQHTRRNGKRIRQAETDVIKKFVEYAKAQGSQNAPMYYTTLTKLANKTAAVHGRDMAHGEQLFDLSFVEKVIAKELNAGMSAGRPYKEIYHRVKALLEAL